MLERIEMQSFRNRTKPRAAYEVQSLYGSVPLTLGLFLVAGLLFATPSVAGPYNDPGISPSVMTRWASAVDSIVRGPLDIAQPGLGLASAGIAANALGASIADPADTVSLGDGGSTTLFFDLGISDGPDVDFAVFENGFFSPGGFFGEFAYVEVSSDGSTFVRFPTDTTNPFAVFSFDTVDPTEYFGVAGRHQIGLGTGFDLSDLAADPAVLNGDLDLSFVRYVRVVDVIGDGSTFDSNGNPLYDPYATAFATGGFDLEAIGVVHVPETNLHLGMLAGLLCLSLSRPRPRKSRHGAGSVRAPQGRALSACALALLGLSAVGLVAAHSASALTVDFEDQGLGPNAFLNGSTVSGSFVSGGVAFENNYNPTFNSFSGYAISTMTDTTTPGFGNQFSAFAGSGAGGSSTYGVAFFAGSITLPTQTIVAGAEFTNTTYAALSMRDGDAFAKQFGGVSGDDADFFRLLVEGVDGGGVSTGTVELMLADYRFSDNAQDFILDTWQFLDLTGLGRVKELRFSFESSDVGAFGINTPTYFAIDNLVTIPEPGTALLLGVGLAGIAVRNRRRDVKTSAR